MLSYCTGVKVEYAPQERGRIRALRDVISIAPGTNTSTHARAATDPHERHAGQATPTPTVRALYTLDDNTRPATLFIFVYFSTALRLRSAPDRPMGLKNFRASSGTLGYAASVLQARFHPHEVVAAALASIPNACALHLHIARRRPQLNHTSQPPPLRYR